MTEKKHNQGLIPNSNLGIQRKLHQPGNILTDIPQHKVSGYPMTQTRYVEFVM